MSAAVNVSAPHDKPRIHGGSLVSMIVIAAPMSDKSNRAQAKINLALSDKRVIKK